MGEGGKKEALERREIYICKAGIFYIPNLLVIFFYINYYVGLSRCVCDSEIRNGNGRLSVFFSLIVSILHSHNSCQRASRRFRDDCIIILSIQ